MSQLSSRENFARMMRGEGAERLPLDIGVTGPVVDTIEREVGTRDVEAALGLDVAGVGVWYPPAADKWRAAYAAIGFEIPANCEVDDLGLAHAVPDRESVGEAWHLREMLHPLSVVEDVNQLEAMPWPNMGDPQVYAHLPEQVAKIHARGKVAEAYLNCTIFEHTWYLRGMDSLFMDLVEESPVGNWLLDWFTQRSIKAARQCVLAGVDVVQFGDDVGTQRGMMMAPDFWREHLKPRLKSVIDSVREAEQGRDRVWVKYHSDGDVREIIPDLVEIGVDILNPIQPECMAPSEVIPAHQHHIAFWGTIGTQTTMPFGSVDDVRSAVDEVVNLARNGARIVIAPTHVIEPDVPWANIVALCEAVKNTRL